MCKCSGRPQASRKALTSTRAPEGRSKPAISLIARIWQPARLQLLGDADIIGERIFGAVRIENVAGVADRALGELACLANGIDRDAHILDPVEAIENTEEIDAVGGPADEIFHDIVGIIGVADAIGAAQQHLGQKIWRPLAHEGEALPRILGEKSHRDVESRAAPAFEREQLRQPLA